MTIMISKILLIILLSITSLSVGDEVNILSYCNVKYQDPMKGAGEWQKPTIPLILVPGVGGSMLHSRHDEPIKLWLSITRQEILGTEYLSTTFDPQEETIKGRFYDSIVQARDDFHGLCSIDNIDPDLIIPSKSRYYNIMINWATSLGYVPGKTLFGFPYDFRRSVRDKEVIEKLSSLIDRVSKLSPTGKVDVISHSMGGVLMKSFLVEKAQFRQKIRKWIPIGTPWLGSTMAFHACIKGYNLDIPIGLRESVAKQLEFGWPPTFELMPNFKAQLWANNTPWISYVINGQLKNISRESDVIQLFRDVNEDHYFERLTTGQRILQPFDMSMYNYTRTTIEKLNEYGKEISGLEIHNIVGDGMNTRFGVQFKDSVSSVRELKDKVPSFTYTYGDGTVPIQSALSSGFKNVTDYILGEPVEHQKLIESKTIMNAIRNILGLSCKMEGHWNITIKGIGNYNETMILDHTYEVIKPGRRLFSNVEIGFVKVGKEQGSMILSPDCLKFKGELGDKEWEGVRIIGSECLPNQIDSGRECIYGRWSTKKDY